MEYIIEIENVMTYDGPGVWVARPGPLSNPWSHKKSNVDGTIHVATRTEAIDRYKLWLDEQLKDPNSLAYKEFHRLLERIRKEKKLVLLCFCWPKNCHATVIREKLLASLQNELKQVQCI
jgi:hypothetical protein